jgi:REP element-mobilizing transposase RayT
MKRFQPLGAEDLTFAYCYHIYLAFRTHKSRPIEKIIDLATLNRLLEAKHVRIIEFSADSTSFKLLASLRPTTSVAAAAGMIKGQISKWINGGTPAKCLSRGYFACTSGKARKEEIDRYLDQQGEHHKYSNRMNPPVYKKTF